MSDPFRRAKSWQIDYMDRPLYKTYFCDICQLSEDLPRCVNGEAARDVLIPETECGEMPVNVCAGYHIQYWVSLMVLAAMTGVSGPHENHKVDKLTWASWQSIRPVAIPQSSLLHEPPPPSFVHQDDDILPAARI